MAKHRLVAIGDSLTQGFLNGAIEHPEWSYPAIVAEAMGAGVFSSPRFGGPGGIPLNLEWLIRRLASYLTQTTIPDLNSGFRAFRRDVAVQYTHLLPPGFSCVTTITMAFLMNGYQVRYVPIDYETRAGRSKFHWWRDTRRYALQVIRMMLSYDPLRVMLPIAALLGLVFVGKLGFDLVDKDFRPAANTLLLGFAVLQTLAVGLLADLVVRVNRPADRVLPADVRELGSGDLSE